MNPPVLIFGFREGDRERDLGRSESAMMAIVWRFVVLVADGRREE